MGRGELKTTFNNNNRHTEFLQQREFSENNSTVNNVTASGYSPEVNDLHLMNLNGFSVGNKSLPGTDHRLSHYYFHSWWVSNIIYCIC